MSKYICNKCNKDLKYSSHLKRHQSNKKDCSKSILEDMPNTNIVSTTITNINNNDNDKNNFINNDNDSLISFFSNELSNFINGTQNVSERQKILNDVLNLFKKSTSSKKTDNTNADMPITTEATNTSNITDINSDYVNNNNKTIQHICINCNKIYSDRQSLYRHKKLNRCKKVNKNIQSDTNLNDINNSRLTFDNIINSNLTLNTDNSNTTNNNSNNINSNNTNNSITININPFKCESLEHITIEDFKIIYKYINNIDKLLCYFIYKRNTDNISFYKNNINQDIVSFFNDKLEIQKMTDEQFIKELKNNIDDSKIELFYNFKNELSQDEILKYMTNMIVYHNNLINNEPAKKDYNDVLRAILDTAFRDKEKKILINNIIKQLNQQSNVKNNEQNKNKNIIKNKKQKLKEYDKKPDANNNDPKNLYKLKTQINNRITSEERRRLDAINEIQNNQQQNNQQQLNNT